MKKALLITAIAAVSISAAACSSKKATETTAAPAETTAAETTTEAETDEDYTSGIITAIDGDVLTVKDDYNDEEKKYDISGASRLLPFLPLLPSVPMSLAEYTRIQVLHQARLLHSGDGPVLKASAPHTGYRSSR